MPEPLRRLGQFVGIVLLVLFATYQHDFSKEGGETREETRVGVWFSPWLTWSRTEKTEGSPTDASHGFSSSFSHSMEFMSWSWVALIGGVVLLRVCRRKAPSAAVAK